jgi:hypothetical protein
MICKNWIENSKLWNQLKYWVFLVKDDLYKRFAAKYKTTSEFE